MTDLAAAVPSGDAWAATWAERCEWRAGREAQEKKVYPPASRCLPRSGGGSLAIAYPQAIRSHNNIQFNMRMHPFQNCTARRCHLFHLTHTAGRLTWVVWGCLGYGRPPTGRWNLAWVVPALSSWDLALACSSATHSQVMLCGLCPSCYLPRSRPGVAVSVSVIVSTLPTRLRQSQSTPGSSGCKSFYAVAARISVRIHAGHRRIHAGHRRVDAQAKEEENKAREAKDKAAKDKAALEQATVSDKGDAKPGVKPVPAAEDKDAPGGKAADSLWFVHRQYICTIFVNCTVQDWLCCTALHGGLHHECVSYCPEQHALIFTNSIIFSLYDYLLDVSCQRWVQ